MKKWNELPKVMQNDKVKYYYDILQEHEKELKLKRAFDIICSLIMIIILSPVLIHVPLSCFACKQYTGICH